LSRGLDRPHLLPIPAQRMLLSDLYHVYISISDYDIKKPGRQVAGKNLPLIGPLRRKIGAGALMLKFQVIH
jgi:hypothetical protein